MQGWGSVTLAAGTSTGNLTQLYPNYAPVGSAIPIAAYNPPSQPMGILRKPVGGRIGQISIKTDSTNGGYVELWDITGLDVPCDVSSLTVITNTQLVAMQTLNKAQLIWSQNFAASPADPAPWSLAMGFMKGLAARFVSATGNCYLNLIVEGGYYLTEVPCGYAG